jgi:acyl-CoA synthetase (AMP-forming)/AMP-acid ligase II
MLALPNTEHFVGAYYGCLIAGLTPVPVAPFRQLDENDPYLHSLAARYKFINAKALIVTDEQNAILHNIAPYALILAPSLLDPQSTYSDIRSTPESIALIQFTSGTSGESKAVQLSQRALVAQVTLLRDWFKLEDRYTESGVSWLPLFHDMGLIGFLLTPGFAGGEINLMQPEDFVLRPTLWLRAITQYKATITGGPPSAYALVTKRVKESDVSQYDLSSIRVALIGAEMVTRESVLGFCNKFAEAGFKPTALLPTYGLAENSLAVTIPPLNSEPSFDTIDAVALAEGRAVPVREEAPASVRVFASVGVPLPETVVRIVDETGQALPDRRLGEITVRSPSLMNGYVESKSSLQDGFLYTGDLGYRADGNLYVTGRKKEMIIVGGRNYYPDDVEQLLNEVEGVRMDRAVAIGVLDVERATERLVVLAETDRQERTERDALRMAIRQMLLQANYPIGEVVLLRPKTIKSTLTGKLKRLDCRERYLAGEFGDGS